ncbi:MAG: hypothetical protein ACLQLH_17220 [Terracidiphilus sp.]
MPFISKKGIAFFSTLALALCCTPSATSDGQKPATEPSEAVFNGATIAAFHLQEAIDEHIANDANFHPTKQMPEDKRELPPFLVKRDMVLNFDWTTGQHARYLMEELRQGIHQLQSAEKASGLDGVALAAARENWPKMRDVSCRESPGIRYYDLDGFEQYCPE